MMEYGICKLCDSEAELCKSHIIPKAIFRDAMANEQSRGLNMYSEGRKEIGKMAGEYESLLCKQCELLLGNYDEYGIKFTRSQVGRIAAKSDGGDCILTDIDVDRLRLFFISVLWRSSISSRPFFSNVNLCPSYSELAKSLIKKDVNLLSENFIFVISRYPDESLANKIIMNPIKTIIYDRLCYNLNMSGFNTAIKVDKRGFPDGYDDVWGKLLELQAVAIYQREFHDSSEYESIMNIARSLRHRS